MGVSNFFNIRIRTEENIIKKSQEALGAVGVLEVLMGGAFVLGTLSGIFTVPAFLGLTIPAIFGAYTMKELKHNIKDSRDNINRIKSLENTGADASRNHERNIKIKELKEEKNKSVKKNDDYSKVMIGGIGGFILGCIAPFSIPISTALMFGGYGTMLFGIHKLNQAGNEGRKIQNEIDKLSDNVAVANLKQKFVMSNENPQNQKKNKSGKNVDEKKYSKEQEKAVDMYIEKLEKQNHFESNNNKMR